MSRVVPGNIGHDGASAAEDGIEEARFADVGPAGDDDGGALPDQASAGRVPQQAVDPVHQLRERGDGLGRLREMVALVREVE